MMRSKQINFSDLQILASLIAGQAAQVFVFDPNGRINWDTEEYVDNACSGVKILFNLSNEALVRYKSYELSDFDHIVDFGKRIKSQNESVKPFYFLQAPSGTIRYMFDGYNRNFTAFISNTTLRGKMIRFALKMAVQFGIKQPVFGKVNIISQRTLNYKAALKDEKYDSICFFTGTPGFWRKPVIQLSNSGVVTRYIKVAISPQTRFLIHKEKSNLMRLKGLRLNGMKIPAVSGKMELPILSMEPYSAQEGISSNALDESLFLAQKELMIKSMYYIKIAETPLFDEVLDQLDYLRNQKILDGIDQICFQLNQLKDSINQNLEIPVYSAHGDFTPWNIRKSKSGLSVYDWEMAIFGAPLLYDLFHFIYQSEILEKRTGYTAISASIQKLEKLEEFRDFVSRFGIDMEMHHKLYLLHTVSKNLMLFAGQKSLSADHKLMLKVWKEALGEVVPSLDYNVRIEFLSDFQNFLADKEYAALKFFENSFAELPASSDLDLAITKSDMETTLNYIANHKYVSRFSTIKKSFMATSRVYLGDGSFLSVDFIFDFIRKGMRYLDCKALLANARMLNGVKVPLLLHNIEYAQHFYTLNGSAIPLRYQRIFARGLYSRQQKDIYLNIVKRKYKINAEDLPEAFDLSEKKYNGILKHVHKKYRLGSFVWLRKKIDYLRDVWVDITQNKGFMLTFSGVDGAGKTTIIKDVKQELESKYRKEVVLLRHRPGILPILSAIKYGGAKKAEAQASKRLPRQGNNKGKVSSAIRFGYYFMDYLIGQVYVYFRYILRGKIVIYDRYYYDFINDSRRSNIQLNPQLVKRFFAFIYKPRFNFYLYNEPEVILKRKQELSAKDIRVLNSRYSALFEEYDRNRNGVYHQIKNDDPLETVSSIFTTINKVA